MNCETEISTACVSCKAGYGIGATGICEKIPTINNTNSNTSSNNKTDINYGTTTPTNNVSD